MISGNLDLLNKMRISYRDDYYEREGSEENDEPEFENNIVEVIIEKNRSGARGTVKLLFKKEFNKFSSMSYVPEPA